MTNGPTLEDLARGRLSQTCPACGRTEASHAYCSWCFRPMGEGDWYPNHDPAERRRRMPLTAPDRPPREYRDNRAEWPAMWGPWPGRQKAPRQP